MTAASIALPACISLALVFSVFFHGGYDISYAPALILCLGVGLYSILTALHKTIALPRSYAMGLTLAFFAYISLSMLWSTVPYASLMTWLNLMVLPILLIGLLCHPDRQNMIRNTMVCLYGLAALMSLYILWQFFIENISRASGPLPNPNNTAALLNLFLLPALSYTLFGPRRHLRFSAPFSALLFAALLATGSRGGLVFCGAGALFLLLVQKDMWRAHVKNMGVMALLISGLLGFFLLFSASPLPDSLSAIGNPSQDASGFERLAIWEATLNLVKDHLWGGTGLGTFYLYYPSYRLPADQLSWGHWAHNDALQFAAETGLLSLLLFYAVIIAWFSRGLKSLYRSDMPPDKKLILAGIMAGLMAFTLHAHIEFQFYIAASLIVCAVMMAAFYHLTALDNSYLILKPRKADGLIWGGSLMIAGLLICLTIISSAAGNWHMVKADQAMNRGDIDKFMTEINKTRRYAPRSFIDPDVRLAGLYVDLISRPGGNMTAEDRQQTYQEAHALLDGASIANPAWADIDHKRAKLYLYIDDETEPDRKNKARASWEKALRKNPMHYHAREEYVRFLIRQGDVEKAYLLIEQGLRFPTNQAARTAFDNLHKQLAPLAAARQHYLKPRDDVTKEEQ